MLKYFDSKKARYENKFLVSEITKEEAENIIKNHDSMFSEVFYERQVNNIYFDSYSLKSYEDNVVGNNERYKIRIRWYGELFGAIASPVLEIKIKRNFLGHKIYFPLLPFSLDENFSFDFLQNEIFSKSKLPKWVKEELRHARLALLNSYKRKYFQSVDKKYRITLDTELSFYNIKDSFNLFLQKVEIDDVIVEVKYVQKYNDDVHNLTTDFPFRLTKSSKYVQGIDYVF